MAWWVKAFASKPGDLSSAPRIHRVEGGNQLLKVLQASYIPVHAHMCTHMTHTVKQLKMLLHVEMYFFC